uniref:Protein KRI1 homolog n=1 Tax=Corethrella appendiculata TaxID=1370023 RepID=U5ET90_9DIPT
MGKIKLFDQNDDEDNDLTFKTNKNYAKSYNEFRKKEILSHLKNFSDHDNGEEDSSSDDSSTDEELIDPEFLKVMSYLKDKNPTKYENIPKFFDENAGEKVKEKKKSLKDKPMTIKDYERKVLLEKGGVYEDDENESDGRPQSPTIVEEQERIKTDIRKALKKFDNNSDDDDGEEDNFGGFLKKRVKSKEEESKEHEDYIKWLADRANDDEVPEEITKPLKPLKDFWNSKKLSKEDAFLRDYILNKRYKEQEDDEIPTYDKIVDTSEDEEELEKEEKFEHAYNFRFEEPDKQFIKQYPRTIEDSVRVEKNKRKEKRKELKDRKKHEKEMKKRELEQLKSIKLQEIREKIQKLKEIAGKDNFNIKEEELESDFDPDEHDRRMKAAFDDQYYTIDEGDEKPEFPDLDKELGIEKWDQFDKKNLSTDEYVADDIDMDADFIDDEGPSTSSKADSKKAFQHELLETTKRKKKKGKRLSKLAQVLREEKPLFNPEDEKTYGEYIDEYYKLEYEDIIGDMPCRFKYVETVPNDFGLSVEEILSASTKELNAWASVKKAVQIRPKHVELNDVKRYQMRAKNENLKRKILPSLYVQEEEAEENDDANENEKKVSNETQVKIEKTTKQSKENDTEGKKKKKKNKNKQNVEEKLETSTEKSKKHKFVEKTQNPEQKSFTKNNSKKRKFEHDDKSNDNKNTKKFKFDKKNQWKNNNINTSSDKNNDEMSDNRLKAFGINPKKFRNKQKYAGFKNKKNKP